MKYQENTEIVGFRRIEALSGGRYGQNTGECSLVGDPNDFERMLSS